MTPPPWDYEAFERRVAEWARDRPDVRAAIVFGSRAREDRPADVWSDLDVVLVVTDTERYAEGTAWLEALGEPWVTCRGATPVGEFPERHVVFDDGLEADFVPVPAETVADLEALPDEVFAVFGRGYRFLVDSDGMADRLAARVDRVDFEALGLALPDEAAFVETLHDAWYHAFWVAKKLRRSELWTAKRGLDGYLKWACLLPVLKWHARAVHGRQSWHAGRFLEDWADERAVTELEAAFADYDASECWVALGATLDLLGWLARETAAAADYDYPDRTERYVRDLIERLDPTGPDSE
jgi:aminoglycoside 6-adenylyltransferase